MAKDQTALHAAMKANRPALATAFWISIFINLALFASPLYSMQVFDRVLSSRNLGTLAMLTMIVAVFLVLFAVLEYARAGVLIRGGVRFNSAFAKPVYELAIRAELAGRSAAASQALKDADTVRDSLSGSMVTALFDVPWTPVFVGICFAFHPAMGVVALTGAVLIFSCAIATEILTKAALGSAGQNAATATQFAISGLRSSETAKGLGMTGAIVSRWRALQNKTLVEQTAAAEKAALMLSVTKMLRMGIQTALLGVGAWLAIDRLISPGVMMASMIIMGRALSPVEQAVANWKRIVAFRAALRRLEELFRELPEPLAATVLPEARGDIAVENLVLRKGKSGINIVKDVSFTVKAGTSVAIIGASGSGKSSLVKAMAGIWDVAHGAVRLDGAALSQWDADQLGRSIGYLPQDVAFMPGTIAENIARFGDADDAAVVAAAKAAGVHDAILKQANGYQTLLGDGEAVLSGGMRQRLALARALYREPRVVIMDEPNSNLDAEGEAALANAMRRLKAAGQTVVVVTHRPQLLADVDSVLVMTAGRIQFFGKRDDVLGAMSGKKVMPIAGVKPQGDGAKGTLVSRTELPSHATAA